MKTTCQFFLALFLLASFALSCFSCRKPCPNTKSFTVKDWRGQKNCTVTTEYRIGEVIYTYPPGTDPAKVDQMHNYLKGKDFVLVDSCPCNQHMELWQVPGQEAVYVDLIDVVKGGNQQTSGIGGEGLSLNIDIPLDTFYLETDSVTLDTVDEGATTNTVLVAIIDSGVDQDNGLLRDYLWQNPSPGAACDPNWQEGIFGFDAHLRQGEPLDVHGHGTQVNGVVAGVASNTENSDYQQVAIRMLNVKFTEDNTKTGSLFKAVCGMYYALNKGAKVLNVSWGYYDTDKPLVMMPLLEKMIDMGAFMVAGMGNDGKTLDVLTGDTVSFWPACFAEKYDSVISVGSIDESLHDLALFSNRAQEPRMTVVSLGDRIVSSYLTGGGANPMAARFNSGTSFAAPVVSRTVAIMLGKGASIPSQDAVKLFLIKNSDSVLNGRLGAPFNILLHNQTVSSY